MSAPPAQVRLDRRTVLRTVCGVSAVGALAGCSTDDGEGGGDGSFSPPQAAVDYLSDVSNYDGFADRTGRSGVTVEVGVEGNGDFWAFGPPAVRIDAGTTVTWEWTGDGGGHSVVDEGGAFESEVTDEAGNTFEHTFDSSGVTRYFCGPHKSAGMKGVVVVG